MTSTSTVSFEEATRRLAAAVFDVPLASITTADLTMDAAIEGYCDTCEYAVAMVTLTCHHGADKRWEHYIFNDFPEAMEALLRAAAS